VSGDGSLSVPGIPFALSPSSEWPWEVTAGSVSTVARPRTDIFTDPNGGEPTVDAVTLLGSPPDGDFVFSARVGVEFAGTFDAGVLLLWVDDRHWAKLCFELSPAREPMVVSVVSRGVSDDANAFVVDDTSVWLRIARVGGVFAFHASTDGRVWRFVRMFVLAGERDDVRIGFEAQSPMADGCRVSFRDVAFARRSLSDVRDGS
jgi:uncharacterized protein